MYEDMPRAPATQPNIGHPLVGVIVALDEQPVISSGLTTAEKPVRLNRDRLQEEQAY